MERAIFFEEAADFSHHLLWHVSGNKQNVINKERFVRAELVQEQLRDYAKDLR